MDLNKDLNKINSLTKYPSIPTYHRIGDRGKLFNEVQVPFDSPAIITEKIDGTNGRIILFPDGLYIIGSREELLYGKGDLIGNPQLGIVDELRPVAEQLSLAPPIVLTVYYFEVYGGKISKTSKNYTAERRVGHRLFDVAKIPDYEDLLNLPIERISAWREEGNQRFIPECELNTIDLPKTPRIGIDILPTDLIDTYHWLESILPDGTKAGLDIAGRSEGVVVRTPDRSRIAKIRFEDYERTLRK